MFPLISSDQLKTIILVRKIILGWKQTKPASSDCLVTGESSNDQEVQEEQQIEWILVLVPVPVVVPVGVPGVDSKITFKLPGVTCELL